MDSRIELEYLFNHFQGGVVLHTTVDDDDSYRFLLVYTIEHLILYITIRLPLIVRECMKISLFTFTDMLNAISTNRVKQMALIIWLTRT